MTTTVNVIDPLVGPVHLLTEPDVENWLSIIALITTDPCDFEVHYNDQIYTGSIAKTVDETTLQVAFDDNSIALPSGMCLLVTCNVEDPGEDGCYPNVITPVSLDQRLMALDESGCPIGFITVQDILNFITIQLDIPETLCDLIPGNSIPEGALVAGDRVLTTNDGCNLKSVPQSDIVCS